MCWEKTFVYTEVLRFIAFYNMFLKQQLVLHVGIRRISSFWSGEIFFMDWQKNLYCIFAPLMDLEVSGGFFTAVFLLFPLSR